MNPAPNEPTPAAPPGAPIRRRDLLAGGLGGLAGLAGGFGTARLTRPDPPQARAPEEKAPQPGNPPKQPDPAAQPRLLPEGSRASFAQFGEDLVVESLCGGLNIPRATFIDIGASDPIVGNNTYLMHTLGARGVLVEPNPAYTDRLKAVRPGDTVVVAGIGPEDRPAADYYMFPKGTDGLNTFDKAQADRVERETPFRVEKVVKVPMLGINRVIAEHFGGKAPDYLSIDIEGFDYPVLKALDYTRFRPKLICAETLITASWDHNPETTKLLIEKGYEVRGMTFANTFYVDKKLLDKKARG